MVIGNIFKQTICLNSFVCTYLNGFKYCYLTLLILFDINNYLQ